MYEGVRELLPQKGHNMLVEHIDSLEYNKSITGKKLIRNDEIWVIGEKGNLFLPGSFIFEAMVQFGGILLLKPNETIETRKYYGYVYQIDKLKFIGKSKPGDTLLIKCKCKEQIGKIFKILSKVYIEENKIAEGMFTYILSNE